MTPKASGVDENLEVSFIPMEAVSERGALDLSQTARVRDIGAGYTFFAENDLTVAKITPCFENGKGAIMRGLRNGFGFGTTEFHVIRAGKEACPAYLYWLTQSTPFRALGEASMKGSAGQKGVPASFIENYPMSWPAPSEQERIAQFLDAETARIDGLILSKERMLELLRERREAIIHRAVTRGLDPSGPMMNTGLPWMPEIPSHWQLSPLRYLLRERLMYGANEPGTDLVDGDIRFVRITDIDENGQLRNETIKTLPADIAEPYLLDAGDLLLARSGATVGKVFRYSESWGPCCFAGYLIRTRLNKKKLDEKFGHLFLSSPAYWQWVSATIVQSTIQNISADRYNQIMIPVPSLEEQEKLVSIAAKAISVESMAASQVRESIKLLKELRAATITTYVTGQRRLD
jgi:restriction endonuclease S subunit